MGAEARAAGRTRRRRRLSDARRRRRSSSNGRWPPPSASVWSFLRLTHCAGGIAAASWVRAVSLGSTSAARRNPARPRSPRTRPVRPRSALAARCPDEGDRRRAQRPAGTAVLPEPLFCHPPGQEILTARSRRGQVEPAAARATPREPAARLAAPDLIRLGPTAGASNLSRRLPDMSAGIRLGAPLGRAAQNARRRHPTGPALSVRGSVSERQSHESCLAAQRAMHSLSQPRMSSTTRAMLLAAGRFRDLVQGNVRAADDRRRVHRPCRVTTAEHVSGSGRSAGQVAARIGGQQAQLINTERPSRTHSASDISPPSVPAAPPSPGAGACIASIWLAPSRARASLRPFATRWGENENKPV